MFYSARLQLLTFLVVYATCAHAIMVKFGTKNGPIELPPPETSQPVLQPYRIPAPVWEESVGDLPDPNAQWRPQLFIPKPRYTNIVFQAPSSTNGPINNAQSFVNSYIPKNKPVAAQPVTNYMPPSQILSSQALPGYGIRYFVPAYIGELEQKQEVFKQDDAKINHINHKVDQEQNESPHDVQWKYEKSTTTRNTRHTAALAPAPYPYQWPEYVPHRQQ